MKEAMLTRATSSGTFECAFRRTIAGPRVPRSKAGRIIVVFALAALLLASAGCGANRDDGSGSSLHGSSSSWRIESVGGGEFVSIALLVPGGLVWSSEATGDADTVRRWNASSATTQEIRATQSSNEIRDPFFCDGRLYWLYNIRPAEAFDSLTRSYIVSMNLDGSGVETLTAAAQIGALRVSGDRLAWTQRSGPDSPWSIMTMRTADKRVHRVVRLNADAVDIALGRRTLAWAVPESNEIRVVGIDAGGSLLRGGRSYSVGSGTFRRYQTGSLVGGDELVAWTARGAEPLWHVYALSASGDPARRVSVHPSRAASGIEWQGVDEDLARIAPVVARGRVSWRHWEGLKRQVITWAVGETSPTVLATYEYPDYVAPLAAFGERIAWAVNRAATDSEDDVVHGRVVTWRERDATPTVLRDSDVDVQDDASTAETVVTDGDRIAWDWGGRMIVAAPVPAR